MLHMNNVRYQLLHIEQDAQRLDVSEDTIRRAIRCEPDRSLPDP
jgi:hypothetical protein